MTIYIDLVIIVNFIIDVLLLMTVKIVLKRNIKIKRIILGSLIGGTSILLLFIPINNYILFFSKIIIGLLMVLVTFGYKGIRYTINNLAYLYMSSTILGGILYLIDIDINYKKEGFLFSKTGLSLNLFLVLLCVPIILFLYIKSNKKIKLNYNLYYEVILSFDNISTKTFIGYLDTGNKLKDPITNKSIILIEEKNLRSMIHNRSPMYIPIKTVNKNSLLKCYKPQYLEINKIKFDNYLIGIIDRKINIDGVNCLLNNNMMEELNV